MYDIDEVRELLIETCYSNKDAERYFSERLDDRELLELLVQVAVDDEDYGGDAPMAAGEWIYKYKKEWLSDFETVFLDILRREFSVVRTEDIALALAKIDSIQAKLLIEKEIEVLEYGPRCERFKESLRMYEQNHLTKRSN